MAEFENVRDAESMVRASPMMRDGRDVSAAVS